MKEMPPLGMTKDQIKRMEKGVLFGESKASHKYPGISFMYFRDIVAGFDSRIYYIFSPKGEAFKIVYVFQKDHVDKNLYVADHVRIKTILVKLYGTPKIDRQIWDIDFYRDKPNEWVDAIAYGHMHYGTGWEEEDTVMRLTLRGVNGRIRHELTFIDKDRMQEVRKELGKVP